jgi:hypothetical protein
LRIACGQDHKTKILTRISRRSKFSPGSGCPLARELTEGVDRPVANGPGPPPHGGWPRPWRHSSAPQRQVEVLTRRHRSGSALPGPGLVSRCRRVLLGMSVRWSGTFPRRGLTTRSGGSARAQRGAGPVVQLTCRHREPGSSRAGAGAGQGSTGARGSCRHRAAGRRSGRARHASRGCRRMTRITYSIRKARLFWRVSAPCSTRDTTVMTWDKSRISSSGIAPRWRWG